MVYQYRVTLTGIKGFFRLYCMRPETTLYTFHKQMRADMEFAQDQLILFKALDAAGNVVARYGQFDLGSGTVDTVTVAQTVKLGVASFVYFYDVTNRKSVNVTFEGEVEGVAGTSPYILETKGPNPIDFENGYVAYEDLPNEQRHLPGEPEDEDEKAHKMRKKASLLPEFDPEDEEDGDEPEDEEEEYDDDEDGKEIFDGSEELSL
ncbi:MAG: hypothetical protein ILA23_04355 [Bacteroidales bacterium]|nr:hypothetical protein [Bacteroidales bacterium]MBQ2521925.1 hypothetical protein [Bacteroidales bacterium]MBR1501629.1 hypothetical protein [Bacteroidales bacterium]